MAGGGGKGGSGGSGGGGLSAADMAAIEQALGQNIQQMGNRYQQLGLGVPDPNVFGGDPLQAATAGGSLQWGSEGTAQQFDVMGLQNMADAALGQLQSANQNNPAIAGTPANQLQNISNQNQLTSLGNQQASNASFGNAFNSGGTTTGA